MQKNYLCRQELDGGGGRIWTLVPFFLYLIIYKDMNNDEKQPNGQLQIELTPDVAQGVYANLALITHSSSEFIVDFVRMLPGMPKAGVQSRVILSPEHAKRLLFALQENIMRYEQNFGQIRIPEAGGGRTIAPFNVKQGEA